MLRRCERMFGASFPNRQAVAKPKRIGCAQSISAEARAFPNTTNFCATVTEMERNGILRLPRLNPNRRIQFASAKCQFDYVTIIDLLACRQLRTNKCRIFPGQFSERSGKFLQPAVVCIMAIQNIWIGSKKELEEHRAAPCAHSGDILRCSNFSGVQLR